MNQQEGFSLIEVLLSLMLTTVTALSLLQQQWHSARLFHQFHLQREALLRLDNASEAWLSHASPDKNPGPPFDLKIEYRRNSIKLDLAWRQQESGSAPRLRHLSRTLPRVV